MTIKIFINYCNHEMSTSQAILQFHKQPMDWDPKPLGDINTEQVMKEFL